MAGKLFQIRSFFSYWLDAVDEHSLHSPFLFDLYTHVIGKKSSGPGIEEIEKLRRKLLRDNRKLETKDLGAGNNNSRTIAATAQASLSPIRYSELYSRIIHHFKAQTIIELGTSFGINTLYLAQKKDSHVTTFEGSAEIADIARLTFEFSGNTNIQMVEGNLDNTLSAYLQSIRKIDFAFMDANHRFEPTMNYFECMLPKTKETSVVVLDDIHYSPDMEKAWQKLKTHKLVYGSIDLFRCGILFFDPSLNKQHVILQF